ncbi:YggT family protein [Fictibacillus sp. B-59209]|uniref:YggT family protein n=1 Tax=Fictibacillus sp. B-59209 TaxID=3024873 RepID=UPI002E1A1024|nr:YggT family protein [Fictibacillus sp. B-59209]
MGSIILQAGQYIYDIYYWMMIIFILGSWFPQFHATKVGMWIGRLVEPYFAIFRRFIPPLGVIDLSPLVALIAYRYLGGFALAGLRQIISMIA